MCGRALLSESKELAEKACVEEGGEPREKDVNAPPGSEVPVIIDARPGKLHYVKWGLIPKASGPIKYNTIYCRIEGMFQSPIYKPLIGNRHCVFVQEGFYEWDQSSKEKQPYFFHRKDGKLIYMAGFWDTWKDPSTGVTIVSATMLMQPANELISKIHNRMGCILTEKEVNLWLNTNAEVNERLSVLHAVPEDMLKGWQVDKRMNNARYKGEDSNNKSGPELTIFD